MKEYIELVKEIKAAERKIDDLFDYLLIGVAVLFLLAVIVSASVLL